MNNIKLSEVSKEIKKALKESGIPQNAVSVRMRDSGYSTAWDVVIKDNNISELQIKDICYRFRAVDFDDQTGEIMQGGNRFVFVKRDYKNPVCGDEYAASVDQAIKYLASREDGATTKIIGTDWILYRDGGYYYGSCSAVRASDWDLSRFRCYVWDGAKKTICDLLKDRELDRAYLQNKGA